MDFEATTEQEEFRSTARAWLRETAPRYEVPDPDCDLDYVPNVARQQEVRAALSSSVGLGGHNATVVFRRVEA